MKCLWVCSCSHVGSCRDFISVVAFIPKQNKWFLITCGYYWRVYIGLQLSCALFPQVYVNFFFLILEIVNQVNKSVWAICKNRPTLLISLQLPAIKLCLWNKFPFCYYVLFIAVSLCLHTLFVTVRLKSLPWNVNFNSNGSCTDLSLFYCTFPL